LDITGTDSAAWIVHTVPGYPKPKATYTFPASEYANVHLLLCLTIAESQIEPIAAALLMASPFIHYNDVPGAEVNTRAALKKLINGETAIKPPFITKQNIATQGGPAIPVQVFSKSERSKYGIYFTFRKFIMAILYKPPGEKRGKILVAPGGAWASNPVDLENPAGHSFAKALEHVAGTHANIKFFAYNNAAPGVVEVATYHTCLGVLILDITGTDSAAWIVHTVPGYPK
ncbi:Plancitoxin-1, partial [Trichinella pseudospiralis]